MKAFSFVELLVALALSTVILMGAAAMILLSKATVGEKLRAGDSEARGSRLLHTLDRDLSQIGLGFEYGLLSVDDEALSFMSARGGTRDVGADLFFVSDITAHQVRLLDSPNLNCNAKHFGKRARLLRQVQGRAQYLSVNIKAVQKEGDACVLVVHEIPAFAQRESLGDDEAKQDPNDWVGATLAFPTQVTWRFEGGTLERQQTRGATQSDLKQSPTTFTERHLAQGSFRYFSREGQRLSVAEANLLDVAYVEVALRFSDNPDFAIQRRYALQPSHAPGKR